MRDGFQVRPYRDDDFKEVINLFKLNTPAYFSYEEQVDLENYLVNKVENYFILEKEKRIVGCGGFNILKEQKEGRISWDLIHPDFQNKGLGTFLLNYRIQLLEQVQTIQKIIVTTSQFVYKFYENNNFTVTEIIENYWAEGYHLYNMEFKKGNKIL